MLRDAQHEDERELAFVNAAVETLVDWTLSESDAFPSCTAAVVCVQLDTALKAKSDCDCCEATEKSVLRAHGALVSSSSSYMCSTSSCAPLLLSFETASGPAISKRTCDAAPNICTERVVVAMPITAELDSVSSKQYCGSSDALLGVHAVVSCRVSSFQYANGAN